MHQYSKSGGVPRPGATVVLTDSAGASQRNVTAFGKGDAMVLVADAAFHFRLGGSAVNAAVTDQYWPANEPLMVSMGGHTHIAIIRNAGSGTANVYITPVDSAEAVLASTVPGQFGQ